MMFNWIRRCLINRQRKIFRYWDGNQVLYADPLLLWRLIMTHREFDPATHGPAFDRGEEEAYRVVLRCAMDVFQVPLIDRRTKASLKQPGLTEQELINLFKRFLAYCDDLKKSIRTSQTSPEPTPEESVSSTDYTVPTSVLSALSSMENGKPSEPQGCC
jgi:hypothetical protein